MSDRKLDEDEDVVRVRAEAEACVSWVQRHSQIAALIGSMPEHDLVALHELLSAWVSARIEINYKLATIIIANVEGRPSAIGDTPGG